MNAPARFDLVVRIVQPLPPAPLVGDGVGLAVEQVDVVARAAAAGPSAATAGPQPGERIAVAHANAPDAESALAPGALRGRRVQRELPRHATLLARAPVDARRLWFCVQSFDVPQETPTP